ERFRPWHRISTRMGMRKLHQAQHVICISQFTLREVRELLDIPLRKMSLIYYGGPFHAEEPLPKETKAGFEVPAEFFLFVSSLEPGKNVKLIRQAYELAEARGDRLPPLLLAGSRWHGVPGEGPPHRDWRFLGHQTDETLVY